MCESKYSHKVCSVNDLQIIAGVVDAQKPAKGHISSTLWLIHVQAFRDVTNWGKEQILSGRPQHKIYKH